MFDFMCEQELVPADDSDCGDLKCLICHKFMTDACQSHCGCQYCFKCFTVYINNEDKYCHGDKDDCKEEYLVFDKNIFRSAMVNKKISKVKVNCPNQSCEFKVGLFEVDDHLRLCLKNPIECPYVRIGCCDKKANKDAMLSHLVDESLSHAELLIDCFNNLKEDSLNNERRMTTMDENLVSIKNENEGLRRDVGNMFIKMTELMVKCDEERAINCGLKGEINVIKGDIGALRCDIEAARGERAHLLTVVNGMIEKMEKHGEERERDIIDLSNKSKLCQNTNVDFHWKFEHCSKNIGKELYSETFYSNNYKLCLRIGIYNSDNIGLRCFIMKGVNDDNIQWPMKFAVTLSIVNQDSLEPYKSETYQYDTFNDDLAAFNKPKKRRNSSGIGVNPFTKYSSIKNDSSIITNDSIVVLCALSRL